MAFCTAPGRLLHEAKPARCRRREPIRAEVPVGFTIVAAGVAVGIAGATFENMLNIVYNRRLGIGQSEDELCEYCAGFGQARCEVCLGRGEIVLKRSGVSKLCPLCGGSKWERCKRCAGRGVSGYKKTAESNIKQPS